MFRVYFELLRLSHELQGISPYKRRCPSYPGSRKVLPADEITDCKHLDLNVELDVAQQRRLELHDASHERLKQFV
eukprot:1183898-Prorocentrum_minimum.AAC.1